MKQKVTAIFLWYLRILARLQLLKNRPVIIGITGSAGKTSALNAVEAVLKNHQKIKVSHKANSETGIPLDILGLKPKSFTKLEWLILTLLAPLQLLLNWRRYQVYVVEMAIDSPNPPKNMQYLLKIVRPQIGVFLNARTMHSEPFDPLASSKDPEERKREITGLIATEKGKLIEQLPKDGFAILNSDDEYSASFRDRTKAKVLTIGQIQQADVQVVSVIADLGGTVIKLKHQARVEEIKLPGVVLPDHFGITAAAGVAAGLARGMKFRKACIELERNFVLPRGRASLLKGKNSSIILDSSYNASGQAVIDILKLLKKFPKNKQKIAILGDIRELGSVAELEHQKVAESAAKTCDLIVLVGPQMKKFALPTLKKLRAEARWFGSALEATEFVEPLLNHKSVVLVKGSQNTLLLEIAVEKLMANPKMANSLLCRRGKYCDRERQKLMG